MSIYWPTFIRITFLENISEVFRSKFGIKKVISLIYRFYK